MPQEKSPAYQWYVKDWRSSRATQRMSFAERGVYREMLDEQWESVTLPDSPEDVAELIAPTDAQRAEVLAAWPVVRRKFVTVEGGRIQNLRLERGRKEYRAFLKEKRKAGAQSAAHASRGTNGAFQQRPNSAPTDSQQPTNTAPTTPPTPIQPSSASASSSSTAFATASADLGERAAGLLDHYGLWFEKYRNGAKLRLLHNSLEFQEAHSLVALWSDDHLEKLAALVLTTDDPFIANSDRSFKIFAMKASWADDRLRAWEKETGVTV